MNANELADELSETIKEMGKPFTTTVLEAATMLRQQQAEIEALKAEVQNWVEWKESLNGWSKK